VTPAWLVDRFAELGPNEEMAWHSWVEWKGCGFHIPMIDFVSRPAVSVLSELGRTLATEMGLRSRFVFFETGRSLHGYLPDLISEQTWHRYLDQLRALSDFKQTTVIDMKWVEHALVRGFMALRWSHNTNRYGEMPRLVSVVHPSTSSKKQAFS
jgi:hypothetical protein